MTNKEYITKSLAKFSVSADDVEIILVNQGLNPESDAEVQTAKRALFKEFTSILPLANISEGGMSVSWNIEALKMWYSTLANELGEVDVLNQSNDEVQDVSYLM
jgi:hypothetical protein